MSDQSLLAVRQQARAKGSARLVLMIYACYAREDGTKACPSPQTVADETGLKVRTVYELIAALEADGELVYEGMSSYRTRSFSVRPGGVRPGAQTQPLSVMRSAALGMRPDAQTVRSAALESVVESYPENQLPDKDGLTTTKYSAPGRANCAAERISSGSPPTNGVDFWDAANSPSPTTDPLAHTLDYHGFVEPVCSELARLAFTQGATQDDLKFAIIHARRLEAQGKVHNWHGFIVDTVRREGWEPLVEAGRAPAPRRRQFAANQVKRTALADHLAFFSQEAS